jgi:5-methylcytosine-specific restriction endonuclease McrA
MKKKYYLYKNMHVHRIIAAAFHGLPDDHENMVVDHIIPLCGKKISGLHVIWNMQYLTPKQNSKKGNKWDGTLKNRGWGNK